jgi:hypothetical protein
MIMLVLQHLVEVILEVDDEVDDEVDELHLVEMVRSEELKCVIWDEQGLYDLMVSFSIMEMFMKKNMLDGLVLVHVH